MMRVDRQGIICDAIRDLLASDGLPRDSQPYIDWLRYDTLARLKLPGPDYLDLLKALHVILAPKLYVEIGVRAGDSLKLARDTTACIAIDPAPSPETLEEGRRNTTFAVCTSNVFFENKKNCERAEGFDLAFIDGDHSFEQALRDFEYLEKLAKPSSIICLHDVIPMDERTATPQAQTGFHTGDVWRLMAAIVSGRPDLVAFTVACPPTGLGIVGRFERRRPPIWTEQICEAIATEFTTDWNRQVGLLNIVGNEPDTILAALRGQQ